MNSTTPPPYPLPEVRLLALELEVENLKAELNQLKETLLKKGQKKAEKTEEIRDEVNRATLLSQFSIMPAELENVIERAKEWLLDNPDKGKKCGWTLRTTRVQTFLDKYPKKNNEKRPRII